MPDIMGLSGDAEIEAAAAQFVAERTASPKINDVVDFLRRYDRAEQQVAGNALIDLGVPSSIVDRALDAQQPSTWKYVAAGISTISGATAAYHGYKRNQSVGWAVAWFALGAMFPVITQVVAVAQGYGRRAL
jgi:hypothetical protein